jgi:hypothetical protein
MYGDGISYLETLKERNQQAVGSVVVDIAVPRLLLFSDQPLSLSSFAFTFFSLMGELLLVCLNCLIYETLL